MKYSIKKLAISCSLASTLAITPNLLGGPLKSSCDSCDGYVIPNAPTYNPSQPAPTPAYSDSSSDFPSDYLPQTSASSPSDSVFQSQPSSSGPNNFGSSTPSNAGGNLRGLSFSGTSSSGDMFVGLSPSSYIDNAIVGNQVRLRFDSAYDNPLPDRGEFFYGQCGCFGGGAPGPVLIERSVDYQEFMPYVERKLTSNFSAFIETPIRLINPVVNDNTAGFGDMRVGFKRALYKDRHNYLTGQFKIYIPTGDTDRGLGTGHVSLEPTLLFFQQRTDRLSLMGEFGVWIPISDTQVAGLGNFAGPILRYGLGAGYDIWVGDTCKQRRRLTGVFETVGWTLTDGLAFDGDAFLNSNQTDALPFVKDAAGDTIVNVKMGARYTVGAQSIAASYGRAVTGDVWYKDIFRVEYRYLY